MKNEKDFYDILNSKFAGREVPFDEANWIAMRTMIDSSRAAKKRIIWLGISLSLLLCTGGAWFLANNYNPIADSPGFNKDNSLKNSMATKSNNNKTVNSTSLVNASATQIRSNSGEETNSRNPISASAYSIKSINNQTINSTNLVNASNSPIGSNNNQINSTGPANNNITTERITTNSEHSATLNSVPNNNQPSATTNLGIAVINNSFSKKSSKNDIITKSDSKNIAANNNASSADNERQSRLNQDTQGNSVLNKEQSPNLVANTTNVSPLASNSSAKKETASMPKAKANTPDTATAENTLPPRFSDEPRVFRGHTNMFSIEAGVEYSGGWQLGSITQGQGFNPIIGIGYTHYLGSKLFLKTGLQFSTFGNMSTITYNYQHSIGNVIYDSVITTQRLYFLRIPIQAEYYIGHKSSIGLGGSVWFLLGNSGYASTYQQVDGNPPTNVIRYSKNAPLDGYSHVNASAHLLYRYTFSSKFSMYGIMYFEVTNMKDNAFFGENIIERTHGFQLTASYNLN